MFVALGQPAGAALTTMSGAAAGAAQWRRRGWCCRRRCRRRRGWRRGEWWRRAAEARAMNTTPAEEWEVAVAAEERRPAAAQSPPPRSLRRLPVLPAPPTPWCVRRGRLASSALVARCCVHGSSAYPPAHGGPLLSAEPSRQAACRLPPPEAAILLCPAEQPQRVATNAAIRTSVEEPEAAPGAL